MALPPNTLPQWLPSVMYVNTGATMQNLLGPAGTVSSNHAQHINLLHVLDNRISNELPATFFGPNNAIHYSLMFNVTKSHQEKSLLTSTGGVMATQFHFFQRLSAVFNPNPASPLIPIAFANQISNAAPPVPHAMIGLLNNPGAVASRTGFKRLNGGVYEIVAYKCLQVLGYCILRPQAPGANVRPSNRAVTELFLDRNNQPKTIRQLQRENNAYANRNEIISACSGAGLDPARIQPTDWTSIHAKFQKGLPVRSFLCKFEFCVF